MSAADFPMSPTTIMLEGNPVSPNLISQPGSLNSLKVDKIEKTSCISLKTVSTVSLIVGLVFLVIGVIALAAYSSPSSNGALTTLLQKMNDGLQYIAYQTGTDPILLVATSLGLGIGLTIAGGVTLSQIQEPKKELPLPQMIL